MSGNNQKSIDEMCVYRGLPKILKGWRAEVAGKKGVIHGANRSCNFNVKMDEGGISNCHPYWKMKIYNSENSLVYESEK